MAGQGRGPGGFVSEHGSQSGRYGVRPRRKRRAGPEKKLIGERRHAAEAGLTDHVWDVSELVTLLPAPETTERGPHKKLAVTLLECSA
jgi:hypothetical protein